MSRGGTAAAGIVNLPAAIAAVERLVQPTARAHGVTVDVQPSAGSVHVRADEAELQNVLINLLLNAVQACKAGGRVVVSVELREQIHVRVADNGCGIGANNLKRIFEPFFSLRESGTGLGLFLSLNCVRRWGGDMRVESTEGQGSTFEVILPALVEIPAQEIAL
jgi:two-component system NtrC family sensor kinase